MKTPIVPRDLRIFAPHSPRERLAGFVIASRTIDKCLAELAGTLGDYHFNCPLDKLLFGFKGFDADQFRSAVKSYSNYEDFEKWLQTTGKIIPAAEVKKWSDQMEAESMRNDPKKADFFAQDCSRLGLNPQMNSTFDWLEADDRQSFRRKNVQA